MNGKKVMCPLLLAALTTATGVSASTVARWDGATADWTSASDWSTSPNYPNNGTPVGTNYQAVIDAPGNYTLTLISTISVDSLNLGASGAIFAEDGTLSATNVQISSGVFVLGGTLENAVLNFSGGVFELVDGTLLNIALGSDLTINQNVGYLAGTLSGNGHSLIATGGTTLELAQDLAMNNLSFQMAAGSTLEDQDKTLSISGDSTIEGTGLVGSDSSTVGQIDNAGVITANVDGQTLAIGSSTLKNTGTLKATNGGILSLGGSESGLWIDNGAGIIEADSGSLVELGGTTLTDNLGTLVNNGGSINLVGTILGGLTPLSARTMSMLSLRGGTFSNLALPGPLNLDGGDSIAVTNVTLGGDANISGGELRINGGVNFAGHSMTVSNGGSVQVSVGTTFSGTDLSLSDSAEILIGNILTIGADSTLHGAGTLDELTGIPGLINAGTVEADIPGQALQITVANLTNQGLMRATNGSTLDLEAQWNNSTGTIEADAGSTVVLGGPGHVEDLGALVSNGGVFNLTGTLDDDGHHPLSAYYLGLFHFHGAILDNITLGGDLNIDGGSVIISRNIDANGHAINVDAGSIDLELTTLSDVAVHLSNHSVIYAYLTVGSDVSINGDGEIETMSSLANAGTIRADHPGKSLGIVSSGTSNTGVMQAINGGDMAFQGPLTNAGLLEIDSPSQVRAGDVTMAGGAVLKLGLNSDPLTPLLIVSGKLDLSSVSDELDVFLEPRQTFSGPYEIIQYRGTLAGVFDDLSPGLVLDYSHPGAIYVIAVPEPAGLALIGMLGGACVFRRRAVLKAKCHRA